MTEESIMKTYKEGINSVITLVKDLNSNFVIQMGSLISEITPWGMQRPQSLNVKEIYENFDHAWAKTMAGFLIELKNQVEAMKAEGLTSMEATQSEAWMTIFHSIIQKGIQEDDEKGPKIVSKKTKKPQRSKALNLRLKLQKYNI